MFEPISSLRDTEANEPEVSYTAVTRAIDDTRADQPGRLASWMWVVITASLAVAAIASLVTGGSGWLPFGLLCAIAAATTSSVRRLAAAADQAGSALMLHQLDTRHAGVLMEVLQGPDARRRGIARWRLVELLPRLTGDDGASLSAIQRACLLDSLTPCQARANADFVLAALRFMPACADEAAVRTVTRLARMTVWTRRQAQVRVAARAVLPVVERRVLERRSAEGASVPATQNEAAGAARTTTSSDSVSEPAGGTPLMRFGFLLACWAIILPYGAIQALNLFHEGRWLLAMPYAGLAVVASQMHRLTLLSRHARIAREILREDDISATGRLAEAAAWPDMRIRAAAMGALTRLLPRLQASDARLLTTAQRRCLYATLNRTTAVANPEYTLALLAALEQIGDLTAIPFVEELAKSVGGPARLQTVSEAARECLPALKQHAQYNTDAQVLLRPAMPPGDPSEMLVRPASAVGSANPALLVRIPDPAERSATDPA